jgi:hypothetical protein
MNELENVWDNIEEFWEFVGENKKLLGVAISETEGLDLLNALRDIYICLDENIEDAKKMLTLLATILLSTSQGDNKFINDIKVEAAMQKFDTSIREILDEKPR